MSMSPEDLKHCQNLVKVLRKDKKNYMFLQPFDLTQVPGYTDVIKKPMDMTTLGNNLEAGLYPDRESFSRELFMIYENAVAYHGKKEQTKWIADQAKLMLKVAKSKYNNSGSEKKRDSSAKNKKLLPTKKNKKALTETAARKDGGGTKLKLKLGTGAGGSAVGEPPAMGGDATGKPKVSIKINKGTSQGKQPPSAAVQKEDKKAKKPRLTLKLGKPKTSTTGMSDSSTVTPKSTSGSASKLSIKATGNSRGKELPKGVAPPKAEPKKTTKKTTTKKKDTDKSGVSKSKKIKLSTAASQSNRGMLSMTPARRAECAKVLSGLKRRQQGNITIFLQPVSDKNIVKDYRAKIEYPMDLGTMQSKLEKDEYPTVSAFALDLRRIFANCLRYNISLKDALRPVAVEVLSTAEELMTVFLARPEHPTSVYPPLLFCWKLCVSILDTLYNLTNPEDGLSTATYFVYPVSFYFGGQFPADYLEKVKKPMDFGTVTKNLLEGNYASIEQFEADCSLVLENCKVYYGGKENSKLFIEQASRLDAVLQQQLTALKKYIKSPPGEALKRSVQNAVSTLILPKPQIHLLLGMIEELRGLNYTDRGTKITEPAMAQFEKPVPLAAFPDYAQMIKNPMDLQTIERKAKSGAYDTPESFEYDLLLIFQNCILYNTSRSAHHLVNLGKYGIKQIRRIFAAKMKVFDDPSSAPPQKDTGRKSPPPGAAEQGPSKKMKVEVSGPSKVAPRISLSSAQLSSATEKNVQRPKASRPKPKGNQPVPLHIAISQVKENFPLRRNVKSLQPWEAGCARFFKELMRHSWISAARPKFIFHVPVPVLFPQLQEAYVAKIKNPMDLTTVECTLLAGNQYTSPEDFVNDVALVFANAIRFNKDGRDIGDPLSCAYYDASIHLLRYCRWLSLELLSEYVIDSDHLDEPEEGGMPLSSWKLTTGNKKVAREEMEKIVLTEVIEKSLEGDRYTWMEGECEKLLKALRHQSDFRCMRYFIQPEYPADYAAYVSKPMDWERCQKTLKKRQYDKFGDVIDDLRLIFSNAMKYNGRHADIDEISKAYFDAAQIMAVKLEAAINKMMVAVSDRIERERIDHNNAEREIEAAERAEKERIRAQWGSEVATAGGTGPDSLQTETSQRIRTRTRTIIRKETDFEVPFFDDEDDGKHERSYFEVVRQQKAMYERQRQQITRMQRSAASAGSAIFVRMLHRNLALKWINGERSKLGISVSSSKSKSPNSNDAPKTTAPASTVLCQLGAKSRAPIQLKISGKKMAKDSKKRKRQIATAFDDDDDEE